MGADGGVVYIPVRDASVARHARVIELLTPFWQFLDQDGGAFWAEAGHAAWSKSNTTVHAPHYILGYYGSDRGDNVSLGELPAICAPDLEHYLHYLYELTFEELDLDCRTTVLPITGAYYEPWPHRLWFKHFKHWPHEEVLDAFGPLASMRMIDWTLELASLLDLRRVVHEETWT